MFPYSCSCTIPSPVLANGSIAIIIPSSSTVSSFVFMFGILGSVCTSYSPSPCPPRFLTGAYPACVMMSCIVFPISPRLTPGRAISTAASRACSAACMSFLCLLSVERSIVIAASAIRPLMCAPISSFTRSPSCKIFLSFGSAQSCAAVSFMLICAGKAISAPLSRMCCSIASSISRMFFSALISSRPSASPCATIFPACR